MVVSKKTSTFALAFEKGVTFKKVGVVVQLVRIPACHAGGRGFESRPYRFKVRSYIGEYSRFSFLQGGFDSPTDYKSAEIAQLVEHNLAKVRVASSSLVFRSTSKVFASLAQLARARDL